MTAAHSLVVFGYRLPAPFAQSWQRLVSAPTDALTAIDALSGLLEAAPEFVPARVQLAYVLLGSDRYRDARAQAMLVGDAESRDPEFVLQQVMLLRRFEAIEVVDRLVGRLDPSRCPPALLVRMASELGPIGLYAQAQRMLDAAGRATPLTPHGLVLRGTVEMAAGETVAATRSFEAALPGGRAPSHVRWLLSLLPTPEASTEARLDGLREALAAADPEGVDAVYAGYGLHNALHALGRHDEAWEALLCAHRARQRLEPYDRTAQHAIFEALMATRAVPGDTGQPAGGPGLVFIVGMHRSGTSVLERMLGGHGEVADGGESYVFPAAMRHATDHAAKNPLDLETVLRARDVDLGEAGEQFRRYARWRADGRRWFTEKLPSNFLHTGHILRALPEARVLHMRRDPIDTCFSNLRTLFLGAAPYAADQQDLADYYRRYQALMAHWHAISPGRILDVDYDQLVTEPEHVMRGICRFCDMDFRDAMLSPDASGGHVATASLSSVRKGLLRGRGGQWKAYAQHLVPLRAALGAATAGEG
jgi:tetratricopeptide (TPR) repeat protein